MTGSKKSEQKPGSSGGSICTNPANPGSSEINSAWKLDTDPALLLPAVKP